MLETGVTEYMNHEDLQLLFTTYSVWWIFKKI